MPSKQKTKMAGGKAVPGVPGRLHTEVPAPVEKPEKPQTLRQALKKSKAPPADLEQKLAAAPDLVGKPVGKDSLKKILADWDSTLKQALKDTKHYRGRNTAIPTEATEAMEQLGQQAKAELTTIAEQGGVEAARAELTRMQQAINEAAGVGSAAPRAPKGQVQMSTMRVEGSRGPANKISDEAVTEPPPSGGSEEVLTDDATPDAKAIAKETSGERIDPVAAKAPKEVVNARKQVFAWLRGAGGPTGFAADSSAEYKAVQASLEPITKGLGEKSSADAISFWMDRTVKAVGGRTDVFKPQTLQTLRAISAALKADAAPTDVKALLSQLPDFATTAEGRALAAVMARPYHVESGQGVAPIRYSLRSDATATSMLQQAQEKLIAEGAVASSVATLNEPAVATPTGEIAGQGRTIEGNAAGVVPLEGASAPAPTTPPKPAGPAAAAEKGVATEAAAAEGKGLTGYLANLFKKGNAGKMLKGFAKSPMGLLLAFTVLEPIISAALGSRGGSSLEVPAAPSPEELYMQRTQDRQAAQQAMLASLQSPMQQRAFQARLAQLAQAQQQMMTGSGREVDGPPPTDVLSVLSRRALRTGSPGWLLMQ